MPITSGGGGRERLDPVLATRDNNLYGLLHTNEDAATVARRLADSGWSARACAWDEYELTVEWCSFTVAQPGGMHKIAGVVDGDRLDELASTFAGLGIGYDLELYDERRALIREISAGP